MSGVDTVVTGAAPFRSSPPPAPPPRPFEFPEIDASRLPSGVRVLHAWTPGLPVVTFSLLVDAGGVHEERERAGLAALTAALLESGAGERSVAEIAEAVEALGMRLSAGAAWDFSHLEFTALRSRLEPAVRIAADLALRPTFPEDEVQRLRREHLASVLQRRSEPRGLANEMAGRFIYSEESPYSRPLSGTTTTIPQLMRGDVEAFHARRYAPETAAIVVVGDVDLEPVRQLTTASFDSWRSAAPVIKDYPVSERWQERRIVIVSRPGAVQSEIRIGHVGVARATPDYFPIVVMNTVLGGAFSSRLNLNLRERQGFTYGVSCNFSMRRHRGPFLVSTAVQTEVTAPAVAEIMKELERIRQEPVTVDELDDARNYLAGVFPLRLQTTDGVAARVAEIALHDLPLDHFDLYREKVLAVSRDEVLAAARSHLHPDRAVIVVVGDPNQVRAPLEALDLGPIEVVDAAALT